MKISDRVYNSCAISCAYLPLLRSPRSRLYFRPHSCPRPRSYHIQRTDCEPEKPTLHGGRFRSWSAELRKENKIKSLAAYLPLPHPPYRSFGEIKQNHATHLQALRRSRSVSRPYKNTFGSSTRPMGVASENSTLPSAVTSFPVSLLFSSPGDV